MGEIMRWRLTRGAQRRIPETESLLKLTGPFEIKKFIETAQKDGQVANDPVFISYSKILSDTTTLRAYLTTGSPAPTPANPNLNATVSPVFIDLLKLDDWLAANGPLPPSAPPYTTPKVADLNTEIVSVGLNAYLPNSPQWQALRKILSDLYYLALVFSAIGVKFSLTEVLGLLTRWLLVMGLVDDLQQNPSPIQTPDDIYAALRWRTLVLPDLIVLALLTIRLLKKAVIVRKPGFADLYITREEWDHYEAAEIASIENILAGELKSRVHVLVNQTKVTTTKEEVTSSLTEQDSTTTDLSQLQQQSSSDISIAAHVDGKVDTSGQYGTTQVNTHLGGSLDYSNASATSKSIVQSHETVARAVSRVEQTTRQVRVVSTLTRSVDKEEHKFDNQQQTNPIVGIYRWVDQIQNVELDRYPHRFLMEFEIPEPGAWTRWLHLNDAARNMINKPPVPLTLNGNPVTAANPPLQPSDINAVNGDPGNYSALASRYMAAGASPPPGPLTVAVNIGYPTSANTIPATQVWRYQADTSVSVPNGYYAHDWAASFMYMTAGDTTFTEADVNVAVGAGTPVCPITVGTYVTGADTDIRGTMTGQVGPISQGTIPVSLEVINNTGFQVNVEVNCRPLDQTYQQWQNDTYGIIAGAYTAMLQAFNDEKAGLSVQQTNPVDANSPDQNAQTAKQELKRQVVEMLIGSLFTGRNAINWDSAGVNPPTTILATAANVAPEIQFLEHAFEWETMSYICYPYFWADGRPGSNRWPDLAVIEGNDSDFADFLRAGSARVVLAARPGFEDQVNFYVQFGILWGGGPMPAPGDPDYLSIADEIKAQQQRPIDVTAIDTWQVRLPTTLIWLENKAGLPKNPNPTIDTTPQITAISPASGSVGDSVTIAGKNFGDIEGSSTVSFNGSEGAPTRWSATSIDVAVPVGATTGNVVVTVNNVASNGVNFAVN